MRAAKKPKAEKQRAPFQKGRNAVAHPLAPEDKNKRAFTNASGKKSECRKTTRPHSKKGATLLRTRSLQKTTINAR